MDDKTSSIENLYERLEAYSKTSVELYKLKAIEKTAEVSSNLASGIAVVSVACFFVLFINLGIAMWLGELLGKIYYGFFIVAGFYAFATLLIYLFRKQWIKRPISNTIITHALK